MADSNTTAADKEAAEKEAAEKKAADKAAKEAATTKEPDKAPTFIVRGVKVDPNGKKVGS